MNTSFVTNLKHVNCQVFEHMQLCELEYVWRQLEKTASYENLHVFQTGMHVNLGTNTTISVQCIQ